MNKKNEAFSLIKTLLLFIGLFASIFSNSCGTNAKGLEKADIESESTVQNIITRPPSSLNLDTFYKKYLDASGIPVISSEKVPDEALFNVQKMVNAIMIFRPDVLAKMIENKMRVGIMAQEEVTSDMPEYRNINQEFPDWDWDKDRGTGATINIPLSTCAEENILCYGEGNDMYFNEDIFIHEFAHGIHALGIVFVDTNFETELQEALDHAIANNLWENTYAATNISEYFAEGVQCWFNVNDEASPANGIHNEINTREELRKYDPTLYIIIKRYFKKDNEEISCHQ